MSDRDRSPDGDVEKGFVVGQLQSPFVGEEADGRHRSSTPAAGHQHRAHQAVLVAANPHPPLGLLATYPKTDPPP